MQRLLLSWIASRCTPCGANCWSSRPARFAGREFDARLLDELPERIDACGENGEFHTSVTHGPMFERSIDVVSGATVEREGFVFVT